MQTSINNALNALISNTQIEALKQTDATLAILHAQLAHTQWMIKQLNLEEEEAIDCALLSLYLFLYYLKQQHSATLKSVVAKEYLRQRRAVFN